MNGSVSWTKINTTSNWTAPGGDIGALVATLTPVWSNYADYTFIPTSDFTSTVHEAILNRGGLVQLLLYSPDHEAAHPVPATSGGFIRMYARNTAFAATLTVSSDIPLPPEPVNPNPRFGIDYGPTNFVQTGFLAAASIAAGACSNAVTNAFGDGRTITVLLRSTTTNLQSRLRIDVGNTPYNFLVKDLFFASGGNLTLTLSGLAGPSYTLRGWFNDSEGSLTGLQGDYQAQIDGQTVDSWLGTYTQDAATGLGYCEFTFAPAADGSIQITFDNANTHTMINGFELEQLRSKGTFIILR